MRQFFIYFFHCENSKNLCFPHYVYITVSNQGNPNFYFVQVTLYKYLFIRAIPFVIQEKLFIVIRQRYNLTSIKRG